MRAQLLTGFGGPEMLHYRDDLPEPVAGPGEVRVRVAAAGLNNTDIWTREGRYGTGDDPAAASFIADPDNPFNAVGEGNASKPIRSASQTLRAALAGTPVSGFRPPPASIVR